ncbi:MAG: type II toxin-antitoxin system Phd/YefM family antitoxin [Ardenticatenales bacterium]|nr:type II toxin-antitoxin system Phd/YefM family antitoxin [Ardenticatenales bacterium]
MNYVGVRELKNDASEVIRAVREEQAKYIVTYHGRPVAVILPVDPAQQALDIAVSVAGAGDDADYRAEMEALRAEIDAKWRSDKSAVELVAEQRR